MRCLFVALVLAVSLRAEDLYVTQAGAGTADGSSLANAWSVASLNTAGNWGSGAGKVTAGDTVYISGATTTRLTIQGSGTNATTRITLKGVNSAALVGINGGAFDYIAIIGFTFTQTSANTYVCIVMAGCTGWLIQDNSFTDTYGGGINADDATTNSNNIIRSNLFDNVGGGSGGSNTYAADVCIELFGASNLVEYNTILESLDRVRLFGSGNISRNNYFGATDTALYASSTPYPFHTDGFQGYEGGPAIVKLLVDKNYDTDNRDTIGGAVNSPNGHFYIVQDGGVNNFNWHVVRFNISIREAEAFMVVRNVDNGHVYNNTIVQMQYDKTTNLNNAIGFELSASDTWDFRNNTFPYNPRVVDSGGLIVNKPATTTTAANHSYNTSNPQAVLPTGASPANLSQIDPLFTAGTGVLGSDNYTLTGSSPLKATGAYATLANGAGSSATALIVDDAKFLFDGWSIADADFIKVGNGSYVQISSIDYDTNTVTLSAARTWSDNDTVIVKGMEDVGALPYDYAAAMNLLNTTATTLTAGAQSLTATSSTTDAVRKIEFFVDGIPVGEDYSSPYSVAWTSDGAAHTIEARAYNMWASATLTVSSSVFVNQGATAGGSNPSARGPVGR